MTHTLSSDHYMLNDAQLTQTHSVITLLNQWLQSFITNIYIDKQKVNHTTWSEVEDYFIQSNNFIHSTLGHDYGQKISKIIYYIIIYNFHILLMWFHSLNARINGSSCKFTANEYIACSLNDIKYLICKGTCLRLNISSSMVVENICLIFNWSSLFQFHS